MFSRRDKAIEAIEKRQEAIGAELRGILAQIERLEKTVTQPYDDTRVRRELHELREDVDAQRLAIAEGIERVDRSERRIRAVVQRAQKRLEDAGYADDTLDAEAEQLQLLHGGGGGGEPVHPVPAPMAHRPAPDLTGIPGEFTGIPGDFSALRGDH